MISKKAVWPYVALTVAGWAAAGTVLLVASHRDREDRQLRAERERTCTTAEIFSARSCRVSVPGTMEALTNYKASAVVDGRHITMPVAVAGQVPPVTGLPVQVVLDLGEPVHIEGTGVNVDVAEPESLLGGARAKWLALGLFATPLTVAFLVHGRKREREDGPTGW